MANLGAAFSALPKKIRDWLSSEDVTDLIANINDDFDISEENESIIARLILRLSVQNLEPRDFVSEVSVQLDVDNKKAKDITKKIYDNILKSIESELKTAGVDVGLMLEYAREEIATSLPRVAPRNDGEAQVPPNLPAVNSNKKPVSNNPFILHQEDDFDNSDNYKERPSFKYHSFDGDKSDSGTSSRAQVEAPAMKVVHYSDFMTPLNQATFVSNKMEEKSNAIPIPKSRWFK